MKHKIFRYCLNILRKLSELVQIGNPARRAPTLIGEPSAQEKIQRRLEGFYDMFIWQLHNVICSGMYGGVVINKCNQVYTRFTSFPWGKDLHPSLSLPYLGRKLATLEKAAFLITPEAKGNYYHWMTDLLPRLLLIKKYGLPDFEDRQIILHHPPKRYENDTLSLLEIKKDKIIRLNSFEFVHVKNLVISDYVLSQSGMSFPVWKGQLLDEFKDKVLEDVTSKTSTRLYLLRGKQRIRRLIGEERLVGLLKETGFHIIDPQQMTLAEQIHALAGAQIVVAPHGAALTNIVFCKENTLIVELRSNHKPPEYFSEIAKTYNLRFESVGISPKRMRGEHRVANEQNLVMTEESIHVLMNKIQ